MNTYPSNVRIGTLIGTAVRKSTSSDDDLYINPNFFETRTGSKLQPRSVVLWNIGKRGLITSTADSALEIIK